MADIFSVCPLKFLVSVFLSGLALLFSIRLFYIFCIIRCLLILWQQVCFYNSTWKFALSAEWCVFPKAHVLEQGEIFLKQNVSGPFCNLAAHHFSFAQPFSCLHDKAVSKKMPLHLSILWSLCPWWRNGLATNWSSDETYLPILKMEDCYCFRKTVVCCLWRAGNRRCVVLIPLL